MSDENSKVFNCVDPARRSFLKRLLAGAAFAAPVIATFSVESLTLDSVHAMGLPSLPNQVCGVDVGYAGPNNFQAHVTTLPISKGNLVNAQVTLSLSVNNNYINSISGMVNAVPGATVDAVFISVGVLPAAGPVEYDAGFTINSNNLNARVVCNMEELADLMAEGTTICTVVGTCNGTAFTASGLITSEIVLT